MKGDRRSASFHREKQAGLTRALSWLSLSTLSRHRRQIFHSQNELHIVHNHMHSDSRTHLHVSHRDEDEDDDNWVYQPQHKIGESGEREAVRRHCLSNLMFNTVTLHTHQRMWYTWIGHITAVHHAQSRYKLLFVLSLNKEASE